MRGLHREADYYERKIFRNYDVVNYKYKDSRELRTQLQTQVYLLVASFEAFKMEHHGVKWVYPNGLSFEQIQRFIEYCLEYIPQNSPEYGLVELMRNLFIKHEL